MKTINLFLLSIILSSATSYSQGLQEAIKLTTNEQFAAADAVFKNLTQGAPNNGELYFYYGENFFKNDNPEQAKIQYQKGANANATNPLCYVGLGKIQWYKGKQAEAKANFFKATTLSAGKNATVLMKIAEAYINADTKSLKDAFDLLTQASKLEPKNPEVYILLGDMYLEQNDGSNAIVNYEKAAGLDPKSVKAILRQGQLYNRSRNYPLALDFYKKASMIDSTFAPAYREKAEIYFRAGQYNNASAQYKKYLQLNNDCSARGRYAGFLNQAKQYKESIDAAKEAIKCDPNNIYLYRYMAYDDFETGDFIAGLMNDSIFFAKADTSVKIISLDYEYRAKLLSKNGKDSLALIEFKKMMQSQPYRTDLFGEVAPIYLKMKKYDEAISAYKSKIEKAKGNVNDTLNLGRAYYYSKDFTNADTTFAQTIKLRPNIPNGYFWRAKTNSQMDPKNEKWLAKPYFETYISKIKPEDIEKNKSDLIGAYYYLAAYYAEKKDCANTKLYMQKVLDLDPINVQAKKVIAGLKC